MHANNLLSSGKNSAQIAQPYLPLALVLPTTSTWSGQMLLMGLRVTKVEVNKVKLRQIDTLAVKKDGLAQSTGFKFDALVLYEKFKCKLISALLQMRWSDTISASEELKS